jgi:hypothetical protein
MDVDDAGGTGPGSYRVQGNIWHLDCCGIGDRDTSWTIFNAIFGWSNNGSRMYNPPRAPSRYHLKLILILLSWNCTFICVLLDCRYSRPYLHEIQGGQYFHLTTDIVLNKYLAGPYETL